MKYVGILLLTIIFCVGLYFNFVNNPFTQNDEFISNETQSSNDETEITNSDTPSATHQSNEEETENTYESTSERSENTNLTFSQEQLNSLYTDALENNETVTFDVFIPDFYSEGFIDQLQSQFNDDTLQFNRQSLNIISSNLTGIVSNADVIIIDALQSYDYNEEVLADRNRTNLTLSYQSLYQNEQFPYLLGNPSINDEENYQNLVSEDASFFTDNDFYYIDNRDVNANTFNEDTAYSENVETQIVQNIYNYLTE